MVESSPEKTVTRATKGSPSVLLVNWPLRDEGVRAWLMLALLAAAAAAAGGTVRSWPMGVLLFATLTIAAWRLWMPVTFEFGPKGVVQTVLGRRRRVGWAELTGYQIRRHGVLLLFDAEPGPLASLRGLYVRWHNQSQRDGLIETLDFYIRAVGRPNPQATTRTFTS